MVDLEVWKGTPPPHWDENVCFLNGTIFHSSHWAEYQSKIQNVLPLFIFAKDKNNEIGVGTVGLFRQSHLPVLSTIVRELVLVTHPFSSQQNDRLREAFLEQCEQLGRQWGCSRVRLESFFSGNSPFVPADHGYQEMRRIEFSLNLERERASLWQGIKKDQRERIRRLEREGVVIAEGKHFDDLKGLKLVRESTQGIRAKRGQAYSLSADERLYQLLDQYLVKRGIGRLFLAKKENEILAGIFYVTFNRKAYSVFSGSTTRGYKLSAQSGLFWGAIQQFQEEGFQVLNRGGVPESASRASDPLHGIYQFKKRLGTSPLTCRTGTKILSPMRETVSRVLERVRALR